MPKAKHFMVTDTETLGFKPNNYVYDLAYVIATRKTIKLERSFLVREIITSPNYMLRGINNPYWRDAMAGKLFSHYMPALDEQRLRIFSWHEIIEILRDDMQTFNVQVFSAYNIGFDMRALAHTQKTIAETGKILTYRPQLLDLWLFACTTAFNSKLYHDIANKYGWVSDAGNVRTNAEKAFAFLTGQFDFIESHTAIEDARIETEILQRLLARKKKIPYDEIQHMPWKLAQTVGID